MFTTKVTILLFTLGLATLIAASGDYPGFCFKNGTGGQGGVHCRSGYGRPEGMFILRFPLPCIYPYLPSYWCKSTGVCNCATGLNSCLANLAGCTGAQIGSFVPPIPPVLYVGTHYEFKINISSANFNDLCFLRPLPAGLSWVVLSSQYPYNQYAISGTPTESIPKADYGVAAHRAVVAGGFATFFSFEVQSCSEADAVYPYPHPTVTSAPSTCTTAENGHMRCAGTNQYQTCDHGMWQAAQSCGSNLVCSPQGTNIYCVRA